MNSGWLKTSLLSSLFLASFFSSISYSEALSSLSVHRISVDARVSNQEYATILADFKAFGQFPLEKATSTALPKIIGIESETASSENVLDFISQWIHFLVPSAKKSEVFLVNLGAQNWFRSASYRLSVLDHEVEFWQITYPLKASIQDMEQEKLEESIKQESRLSIHRILLKTPAVGVVETHDSFFNPLTYDPFNSIEGITPLALSIFRISLLAHEAGHSRGEGYPHVFCPQFLNVRECDEKANGPNGIQAALLWSVVNACDEILKMREFMPTEAVEMCSSAESMIFLRETAESLSGFILSSDYDDIGAPLSASDLRALLELPIVWTSVGSRLSSSRPIESIVPSEARTFTESLSNLSPLPSLPLQSHQESPSSQLQLF